MIKMRSLLVICCLFFIGSIQTNAQGGESFSSFSAEDIDWLNKLYEHGVHMTDDSIFIAQEVIELLSSTQERAAVYPKSYTWNLAINHLQNNELKKGFWHLINLYRMNDYSKDKVLKSVITYDAVFKMEEVLVSSFYTYCYTDPEIGEIKNGQPIINAPHILEEKLNVVKEIIDHLDRLKKQGVVKS